MAKHPTKAQIDAIRLKRIKNNLPKLKKKIAEQEEALEKKVKKQRLEIEFEQTSDKELISETKEIKEALQGLYAIMEEVIATIEKNKITIPKVDRVTVSNLAEIKPTQVDLSALKDIRKTLDKLSTLKLSLPTKAKDAISVRLSNGEAFYNAIEAIANFGPHPNPPVLFKFPGGGETHALVDTDNHLQVDILSGGNGGTLLKDGDAQVATHVGTFVMGQDGSNYQALTTDSDGHLQVDILSGASGTSYTEDVATPAAIVGTANMMERDDALGGLTPAEGDWVGMRSTAEGALWTQDFNSDAILADTAAMVVDLAAIEVLLTGIDADTNQIQLDTTAILADTAAMDTNLSTIAGAVSGTEMQVDIVAVTPDLMLGTDFSNVLGTASLIDGSNHLQVDIAADSVGIGGGTQYAIGTAAGATDTGTAALAIRDDSLTTLADAEGDWVGLRVNSTGALHVTGGGGTEYTEDVATANPIVGTATMMERDDALTTVTPIEGDWISFRGTAEGALWVQDFNSDAILADTANMDTNLGTIAGAVTGTEMQVDVVAALPAGNNNIGNVDIASSVALDVSAATVTVDLGANNDVTTELTTDDLDTGAGVDTRAVVGIAGTASGGAQLIPGSSTNGLLVNLGANNDITGTVTANLSATDNAVLDQIELNTSYGDNTGGGTEAGALRVTIANDSTGVVSIDDNGGSLTVDGTVTANLGATDNAVLDQIELNTNIGALLPAASTDWKYADINDSTSGNNTIVAAQGASNKIAVWAIAIVSDGTVDVRWEDGAAGTAFTGQIPLQAREGYTIAAGGSVPLFVGTANTLLNLELSAAINVHGFVSYTVVT